MLSNCMFIYATILYSNRRLTCMGYHTNINYIRTSELPSACDSDSNHMHQIMCYKVVLTGNLCCKFF